MKVFGSRIQLLICFFVLVVLSAFGLQRLNSVAIWNSTIDSTNIGQTAAGNGTFANLTANQTLSNVITLNGNRPSFAGANANIEEFNAAGVGDADFVAANGGNSPQFYWYYLLGSSLTREMWLDNNGNLNVVNSINANMFNGSLNGTASNATNATNATFATNAGTASATSGNSTTATSLQNTPTNCGNLQGHNSYGIAANGNALCLPQVTTRAFTYANPCTTSGGGTVCSVNESFGFTFAATPVVICGTTSAGGSASNPSIQAYANGPSTTGFTLILQSGTSNSGGNNFVSLVSCMATGLVP